MEHFINKDGSLNLKLCNYYNYPVLLKEGFKLNNTYQKIDGVVTYPVEVLCSTGIYDRNNYYSKNTISKHHGEVSWFTNDEKRSYSNVRDMMSIV